MMRQTERFSPTLLPTDLPSVLQLTAAKSSRAIDLLFVGCDSDIV